MKKLGSFPGSLAEDVNGIRPVSTRPYAQAFGFLLTITDIPVLVVLLIAFVLLSDKVVPTGILLGARDGTTCYINNQFDRYSTVELQQCVLGQHGYWWSMGLL
jgi:hypothetical protein